MRPTLLGVTTKFLLPIQVAKAGDTARDIEEGLNAGCGLAIGVLTGAAEEEGLWAAGADLVLQNITEFVEMRSTASA